MNQMNINDILGKIGIDAANIWIIQVFIVVVVVLFFNFFLKIALNRLHKKLLLTRTPWDDALIEAMRKPLTTLVWIVGIAFAAEIVHSVSKAVIFDAIDPIRDIGIIAMFSWFLVRLINGVELNIINECKAAGKPVDVTTADAISKLLRVSVLITATLVTLQTLGFSISGLLAFGGVGGIAVGFAAKDLLANFFGGVMIFLDRPFAIGDWIRSPDRDIEGTVENIGWRLTRIRTFDKRPLYIPNSLFASIVVENPSRMTNRRIYETIGVRYDDVDKLPSIISDVKEMLLNHEAIDTSLTLMVNLNSYAASSVDFFVYTFTKTTVWTDFHDIKQDVLFKISQIIAGHGAEIAFPTSTIHLAKDEPASVPAGA